MTDTLTYALFSLRRAAENAYSWSLTPNEAGALVAEVERLRAEVVESEACRLQLLDDAGGLENACRELRAEVAWLRSDILPTEPCAACGHAKRTHHDYRDYDGHDVTKCWGGGFDRNDCGARCERFVRFEKETP